jgi:BirA family biotin operon repressor/biotin-[acetyl-CoA-carboxylase] ligase
MLWLFRRDEYANYADSNGMFKAAIRDIDEFGQLVLEDEKGIRRTYGFKEIKYIL